jgi:outer membrane biosynthesis protein TonB
MTTQEKNQKKSKKRGFVIAFCMHVVGLALLAMPFVISNDTPLDQYEQVITMDFSTVDFSASSSSANKAAPAKKVEREKVKEVKKIEQPKPTELEQVEAPKPIELPKPVITTPLPEPPIPTQEEPVETTTPKSVPTVETVEEPIKEEVMTAEAEVEAVEEAVVEGNGSADTDDGDAASESDNDGMSDKGNSMKDFEGDGLLSRRIVKKADPKGLAKKNGKIVINVCVNQSGTVTYTEFNADDSTIFEPELVLDAQKVSRKYRFQKDYTVPPQQCGKLTFIFELGE